MKACDVIIVDQPGETKLVCERSEKGWLSNGIVYVKVIPNAEEVYAAWS